MAAVGDLHERNDRPAYVRFKRVAVEDKAASLAQGKYVARDVDYAMVTPPYSKDCVEIKVAQWKLNLQADVQNDRIPKEWADKYLAALEAWKNGQELPPEGTPIRGWGVISPAQQENLIRINILTVEDLERVNDEGLRRIGMGALDLKNKARAWLAQLSDKGPLTLQVTSLQTENENLKNSLEAMQRQLAALEARVPEAHQISLVETDSITADDILPEKDTTLRLKKK